MTNTAKFSPRQTVEHPRFGRGRIVEVWAIAQNPGEETEYVVKLRGERWPATLGEASLTRV